MNDTEITIIGYTASFLIILNMWFAGSKKIICWWLAIVATALWGVAWWGCGKYWLLLPLFVKEILNIRGLIKWRRGGNWDSDSWNCR
jgi:nicotinamide riboside transporter PnuC